VHVDVIFRDQDSNFICHLYLPGKRSSQVSGSVAWGAIFMRNNYRPKNTMTI